MCLFLLDDTELLTDLDEGFDGLVEVLAVVSSRELYADTSFALRYDRIVETCHVDAFVK